MDYIPKVGDLIIITKSDLDWVPNMDQYIGQIKTISEVIKHRYNDSYSVKFVEGGSGINGFSWSTGNKQFKPFIKKDLKLKIKFGGDLVQTAID